MFAAGAMRRHEIVPWVKNPSGGFYDPAELLSSQGAKLQAVLSMPTVLADSVTKAGGKPPDPITVVALIDTGCTRTAIDKSIVGKLQLPQVGTTKTYTANGIAPATLHPIQIFLPDLNAGQLLPQAMACDMPGGPPLLFGTDLLRHFVMIYDGIAGRVTLIN